MRAFETYLAIGCAVAIVWPALFGVRTRRGIVVGVLVVLVGLQLRVEGYRWQLLSLFVLAVGLAVGDVITIERDLPWFRRIGRGVFGLVGLGLVIAPAILLPVPELPLPSGPLAIGTTSVEIVDPEREELYGERPGGRRRITVQVWYPAEPVEGQDPQPWVPDIDVVGPALAGRIGAPGFFFGHVRHSDSHSYPSAPPLEGSFPLIVYSHGWAGFRTNALDQIENLVSQGYIVIAPDHTHGAVATLLDGEVVPYDPLALRPPEATPEGRVEAVATVLDTYAGDVVTILDEIEEGEGGAFGPLSASMALDTVGVWGHGLGGGAALQVCLLDDRCDAVAGLDPWVESLPDRVLATTATRPMLFLRSDPWRGVTNDAVLRGVADRSQTLTYWVDVLGADHADLIATPLFSPVADRLGMRGPIDGRRMVGITHRYLTGFFDRFLLDTGSAALDTADFPEVDVELIDNR